MSTLRELLDSVVDWTLPNQWAGPDYYGKSVSLSELTNEQVIQLADNINSPDRATAQDAWRFFCANLEIPTKGILSRKRAEVLRYLADAVTQSIPDCERAPAWRYRANQGKWNMERLANLLMNPTQPTRGKLSQQETWLADNNYPLSDDPDHPEWDDWGRHVERKEPYVRGEFYFYE